MKEKGASCAETSDETSIKIRHHKITRELSSEDGTRDRPGAWSYASLSSPAKLTTSYHSIFFYVYTGCAHAP
eukprot:4125084-Pyramimonas_sp.AAC.1